MFAGAYQGKKVFITGHTGFKGSWLAAWLLQLGAEVVGFSLDIPTTPSHFNAIKLADHLQDLRGDIRDRSTLVNTIQGLKPDIIFHLAAQALVRKSYEDPVTTFESNMLGTLNVLEAIRHTPSVQAAIFITSDKCYRNNEWVFGYRETDHLGGSDPYSASKGCAEIIANAYFKSFFKTGTACCTVRAGNVIGGGDWALDRIVPDCARAWAKSLPVTIRNPKATRPWQLVLEPLSGYLWLGAKLLSGDSKLRGEAYNFGPAADVCATVEEVVSGLKVHWPNFSYNLTQDLATKESESTLLKLCCDKALAHLQWKATLNFEETLRYTAMWYHRFHSGAESDPSLLDFTLGQIKAYVNSAEQRGQVWVN